MKTIINKRITLLFFFAATMHNINAMSKKSYESCLPKDLLQEIEKGIPKNTIYQNKDQAMDYFFIHKKIHTMPHPKQCHTSSIFLRNQKKQKTQLSATEASFKDIRIFGMRDGNVQISQRNHQETITIKRYLPDAVKGLFLANQTKKHLFILYRCGLGFMVSIKDIFSKPHQEKLIGTIHLGTAINTVQTTQRAIIINRDSKKPKYLTLRTMPRLKTQEERDFLLYCFNELQRGKGAVFLPREKAALLQRIKPAFSKNEEKRLYANL